MNNLLSSLSLSLLIWKTSKRKAVAIALLVVVVTILLFRTLTLDPSPTQVEALTPIIATVSFIAGVICSVVWVGYIVRDRGLGERAFWALGMWAGAFALAFFFLVWVFKIPIPPSSGD